MTTPKKTQHPPQSTQAGFTIIESLMALIVASILLIALAPIIVLSVGVRVQAKRVERSAEAASSYIDGVRSGAIPPPPQTVGTAPSGSTGATPVLESAAAPPGGSLTCTTSTSNPNYPYCTAPAPTTASVYCVNLDETAGCQVGSANDLVVQGFRTDGDANRGYRLGVRVYRANGFRESGPLKKEATQSAALGSLGNSKIPLLQTTTDIAPSGNANSFTSWCSRLKQKNPNSDCR